MDPNPIKMGSGTICGDLTAVFSQAMISAIAGKEKLGINLITGLKEVRFPLKGLSHEMDFKNVDQNLKNLV